MNIPKSNFSEWYNTIVKDAELCDLRYNLKGFVVFMPWSVLTMERMYSIYEQALQSRGHLPSWFPSLIPEQNLTAESEHIEGFVPEVFWVTEAGKNKLEERYAMRPTSETAMYPLYSLWISGLKDLPLKIYQRAQVWRYETKATKPFIRSREFYWIEAHNVFATEKDAMNQVKEDMEIAEEIIHKRFGIPFLFFKRPQWDKFAGAVNTYAADTLLPDGKALQLPSTHMLGQNFSKPFNIKYMDETGESKYGWQTCYGPCISRIYASLISTHGDEKGLVFPFELAPVQVVIIPIYKDNNKKKVLEKCEQIYNKLKNNFSVKIDDSENTPGFKYHYWEMKGVPIRLEIGEREIDSNSIVLVTRISQKKSKVPENNILDEIKKEGKTILETIISNADSIFNSLIFSSISMDSLKKILDEKGGFVRVPFCTDTIDGEKCAEDVKNKTHGNVRGSLFNSKEVPNSSEKCISCGKSAKIYLYIARQY
ncbi:MAG: proline--tRNA ligase [Candidatus ainarchaeum sp.]|nr:proline--tRNA ligase [Candidatus ainarchaeum sp.]